jgi:hypothetical protein
VSNSSSSSFIIAFKGNNNEMRDKLRNIFGVTPSNNYPIKSMPPIGDVVADNVEDSIKTLDEWEAYFGNSDYPDKKHIRFIKRLKEGWTIYPGGFVDDDNKLNSFLCDSDIDYEDDEIIIWQEGGY